MADSGGMELANKNLAQARQNSQSQHTEQLPNVDTSMKDEPRKEPRKLPLSFTSISLNITDDVREQMLNLTPQTAPKALHPEPFLLPEKCTCGSVWKHEDQLFRDGFLFTTRFKSAVKVYYRKCVKDQCEWHYDGQSDGIFNYSGETLVSYELMWDYIANCTFGHMPCNTYVTTLDHKYNKVYHAAGQRMDFVQTGTFSKVTENFIGMYLQL